MKAQSSLIVEKAELQVNGLTCSMCNLSVYKALKNAPFIDSIETKLNSSIYTLTIKPDTHIDPSVIRKHVEEAGFSVGKLRLLFAPINDTPEKNEHLSYGDFYFHILSEPQHKQSWWGEIKDKKFISKREYQSIQKQMADYTCYKTGQTTKCCEGTTPSKMIYHISLQ